MLASLDLTIPCALVNTIGAFACIFLMQALTGECGLKTKVARIKLLHRLSFVGLAAALIYNAGVTIDDDSAPRLVDFLVQLASLPVISFSAWRHHVGAAIQVSKAKQELKESIVSANLAASQAPCNIQWPARERSQQAEKIQ